MRTEWRSSPLSGGESSDKTALDGNKRLCKRDRGIRVPTYLNRLLFRTHCSRPMGARRGKRQRPCPSLDRAGSLTFVLTRFFISQSGLPFTVKAVCQEVLRVLGRLSHTSAISILRKPAYPRNMLGEQSRKWVGRAKDLWCKSFHNQPMWPVNGRYQCGACLRYDAVRWEQVARGHGAGCEHRREPARRSFNSALIPLPRFALVRLNGWKG